MKSTIVIIFLSVWFGFSGYGQDLYETTGSGAWTDAIWTPSVPDGSKDAIITIKSGHTITATNLSFSKNTTIIIEDGAVLNVTTVDFDPSVETAKDFTLDVRTGGTLNITGDFTAKKEADITILGTVYIDGTLDLEKGGTLLVNDPGKLDVTVDIIGVTPTGTGVVIENGTVILPIILTYFNVAIKENSIAISWQTAGELNNDFFTLERSADAINYEVIGTVNGAGNSSTPLNYSFIDSKPLNGVAYYRLTQTDYNGAYETFNPVSVSYINESVFHVGPNPATNSINISFDGEMGIGDIHIYNMIGAQVKSIKVDNSSTAIDVSSLPSGTYMVVFNAAKNQITKRIIIQ